MKTYAGIGSRATPPPILQIMQRLASAMQQDHILRSGGAAGADNAFYSGLRSDLRPTRSQIFLPGAGFNGWLAGHDGLINATTLPSWQQALLTVPKYHPSRTYGQAAEEMAATGALPMETVMRARQLFGAKRDRYTGQPTTPEDDARTLAFGVSLQARNAMQLLGADLDRPADFIVAWTPDAKTVGGTGQALRMAADYGVPVRNLGDPAVLQRAVAFLAQRGL